ncbi:MAG TPA: MFS transporter [Anaeromyxobacteraceae bacterium]|nr:MFS transporter [Anaeromyxobacteraceae bacterium]
MQATPSAEAELAQPWNAGLERKHWTILTASFLGWVFDGYEAYALFIVMPFMLKALLAPAQLATPALFAGIAISATLVGWGIGGIAGGVLADYVGRKRMMVWSVFLYAVLSGLTAFSSSFPMLVALRLVTGLAMGSEWSTGVALLAETWPNRARPKGAGFLQSGFGVGTFVAAATWLVLSTWNPLGPDTWRLMFAVGALPAFFCLYIRRSIDESERWIQAVKEQRWAAVETAAARDRASAPSGPAKRPFTLAEVFREPESRRRALLTFLLSLATTVGWWAISSWLPAHVTRIARAGGYANPADWGTRAALVYTAGAVLAYLVSGFLADAMGRRRYLFFTFAGCFVMTPVTYLWTQSLAPIVLVAFVNGFFTLGCAYSWMAIYPVELFTSTVRATAASFIFNAARLIAWVFPLVAGVLISSFGGIPRAAMTLGCIYLLGFVVPWFMPETRGRPLPE